MNQGAHLKNSIKDATGGYLDGICDHLDRVNVTNIADASATGSGNDSYQLSPDESGIVIVGSAIGTAQPEGNGFNVDLPTPQRGLWYKFILRAPSIHNSDGAQITVTATSDGTTAANNAIGHVQVNNTSTNVVAAVDVLTFVKAAATAGDYAEYVSDGTNWFVNAVGDAAGSVTLA